MIHSEVIITANCDVCDQKLQEEKNSINIFCDKCIDELRTKECMEIIEDIMSQKEWETYDGIGYENEEHKKMFMKGIKYGMEHAFFWFSQYYAGDEGAIEFGKIAGWK